MQEAKSSRMYLVSAIVIGMLAMVLAYVYLNEAGKIDHSPKISILVAKHDIKANAVLIPSQDLREERIPVQFSEWKSRCLSPENINTYKGQRLNRKVLSGTPVMLADMVEAQDLILSTNMIALTVKARGPNAVGGLLVPGDMVKLMSARLASATARPTTIPANAGDENSGDTGATASGVGGYKTELVLKEAVKVLAVGPRLSRSRQQLTTADQYEAMTEAETYGTVTLEVTESQAKTILDKTGGGVSPHVMLWLTISATANKDVAPSQRAD